MARAGGDDDVCGEPRRSLPHGETIVGADSPASGLFVLSGGKRRSRKDVRHVSRSRTYFGCNVSEQVRGLRAKGEARERFFELQGRGRKCHF